MGAVNSAISAACEPFNGLKVTKWESLLWATHLLAATEASRHSNFHSLHEKLDVIAESIDLGQLMGR